MVGLRKRALVAMGWSATEILLRFGSQLVVMTVLARLLGPQDIGLMAMAMAFVALAILLVDGGLGAALIQRTEVDRFDLDTVFWVVLASGVGLSAATWLTAPFIAEFFGEARVVALVRMLAFVLPISAIAVVPDVLLSRQLRFGDRTKAEACASLVSGGVAVVLALRGHGVMSLAWQTIVSTFVRTGFLCWRVRWRPGLAFDIRRIQPLARFGGFYMASSMLDAVAVRLQSLLLGRLFTPSVLGHYTIAQSTQQAPASVLIGVVNRVGLPVLSSVSASRDELRAALRTALRLSVFVFTPFMLLLALLSEPILSILFGSAWIAAAPIMTLLAIGTSLWPIYVINAVAVQSLGGSKALFGVEIIKQTITILAVVTGIHWGAVGVAAGLVIANVLCLPLSAYYSGRYLNYGLSKQMREIGGTLVVCATTYLIGSTLVLVLPDSPAALALILGSYFFTQAALSLLMRNSALADLALVLSTLRSFRQIVPREGDASGDA